MDIAEQNRLGLLIRDPTDGWEAAWEALDPVLRAGVVGCP